MHGLDLISCFCRATGAPATALPEDQCAGKQCGDVCGSSGGDDDGVTAYVMWGCAVPAYVLYALNIDLLVVAGAPCLPMCCTGLNIQAWYGWGW